MAGFGNKLGNLFAFSACSAGLVLLESKRELRSVCLNPYEVKLRNLPPEAEGKKLVFISDFHLAEKGKNNEKILRVIDGFQPDAILCGGDMVNSGHDDMTPAILLLNAISEKYPVYFALGNHEKRIKDNLYDTGELWDYFRTSLNPDICFLMNQTIDLPGFGGVRLYGLEMERYYFRKSTKERLPAELLTEMLPKREGVSILLGHDPEQFHTYASWGADLVLSGHYHGGMIRMPVLGGVLSPRFRLFPKYDKGIFREGNTQMLVTSGLGQHTIKLRVMNIPEVVGITLKRDE